jgi:hypothetical protein
MKSNISRDGVHQLLLQQGVGDIAIDLWVRWFNKVGWNSFQASRILQIEERPYVFRSMAIAVLLTPDFGVLPSSMWPQGEDGSNNYLGVDLKIDWDSLDPSLIVFAAELVMRFYPAITPEDEDDWNYKTALLAYNRLCLKLMVALPGETTSYHAELFNLYDLKQFSVKEGLYRGFVYLMQSGVFVHWKVRADIDMRGIVAKHLSGMKSTDSPAAFMVYLDVLMNAFANDSLGETLMLDMLKFSVYISHGYKLYGWAYSRESMANALRIALARGYYELGKSLVELLFRDSDSDFGAWSGEAESIRPFITADESLEAVLRERIERHASVLDSAYDEATKYDKERSNLLAWIANL